MLETQQKSRLVMFWRENYSFSNSVISAFEKVNREDFISPKLLDSAYADVPLPLLRGKTISQPTTVMIMTSALELRQGDKVFEVGTGSGYQSAIISHIIGKGTLISTEIIPELVLFARSNFKKAGIKNVTVLEEDGSKGWLKDAPYDKIIITSACKEFPKELLDQLKTGGIIVGPVGKRDMQQMVKAVKQKTGNLEFEFLGPFIFTPMYGKYGFEI